MIRKIQGGDFADGYDPYEVLIITSKKKITYIIKLIIYINSNDY